MHGDDLPVRAGSGLIDQYSCAARIDIEGIPQWSRRLQRLLFRLHLSVFGHIFYFLIMFIIVLCDLIYAFPEFCSVVSPEICTALDAVNAMLLNEFLKEHRKVQEQHRKIQQEEATIAELRWRASELQTVFMEASANYYCVAGAKTCQRSKDGGTDNFWSFLVSFVIYFIVQRKRVFGGYDGASTPEHFRGWS
jgi:hypothetical protein